MWLKLTCGFLAVLFPLLLSLLLGLCLWNMYPWIHNVAPQTRGNSCLPELEQN